MHVRPVLWSIVAVLAAADSAAAQRMTSAIQGTVAGDLGSALSGVTVNVRNQDTGLQRSAETGPDGRYVIQTHTVSYVPSGTTYALLRQRSRQASREVSFLGVGDIPYDASPLPQIAA